MTEQNFEINEDLAKQILNINLWKGNMKDLKILLNDLKDLSKSNKESSDIIMMEQISRFDQINAFIEYFIK